MKKIEYSTSFKKDLKRYKNNEKTLKKLYNVVRILANEEKMPLSLRPHKLCGNYSGFWECHIESDTLLLWVDKLNDRIILSRFGTHSELF